MEYRVQVFPSKALSLPFWDSPFFLGVLVHPSLWHGGLFAIKLCISSLL
jgi:hypothetical protein